jgi:hypothetical protein
MIYDLRELKRIVREKNSFPDSDGVFVRVPDAMLSTQSEPLFRHCTDFSYHIVDLYSIAFLTEMITPAHFQTIATFIRNNTQKLIRFASKILAYCASIACPFRDVIISILLFREMFGSIQVTECPAGWNSSIIRIISHCCLPPSRLNCWPCFAVRRVSSVTKA